jgi:3-oxoacyl-[acyl-carrier protein] reductase
MNLGLKECKAFITGASKGLGKACAQALANEGARVFICSRNMDELKRAVAEFGAVGYSAADVSRTTEVKCVVAEAIAALGGLDCLVTNAGGPPTASFEKAGDADWDIAYQLNLMSAVRLIREALPALKASGRGRIVNLTGYSERAPDRSRRIGFCSRRRYGHGQNHCVGSRPVRYHRQQYRARSNHDRSPHRDPFH